ncbi:Helicase associated domain protein [Streptomyces sp. NPDC054840]
MRELGITLIEPDDEPPQPTGRAARRLRQLEHGLAAVAAFRDREGHVHIRQRDTVTVDGEEFKIGQWLKNLRKRWDTLPPSISKPSLPPDSPATCSRRPRTPPPMSEPPNPSWPGGPYPIRPNWLSPVTDFVPASPTNAHDTNWYRL